MFKHVPRKYHKIEQDNHQEQSQINVSGQLETPVGQEDVKKTGSLLNFIIQFLVVAVLFFSIGFVLGQKKIDVVKRGIIPTINVSNQASEIQNVDFTLFWEVFRTLPQTYYDKGAVDGQKMLYGAISGMVRSLGDPYTSFLDPAQNESVKRDLAGTYEGVGIQIGFDKEKRLVVIAPLRGTPAEKEGVRPKDLILKIDDRETFDLTLPEAVDLIRGDAGTRVTLSLLRDGQSEPFNKVLERAKIEVKTVNVDYRQVDSGEVAVIVVSRFGDKTDGEWDAVITEVVTRKVRGVVVDMRNNPGGLLASSVHLAEEFVGGTIVRQEYAEGNEDTLSAKRTGKLTKVPLVVLVNEGSASAAEIFAGAIQDKRRGDIVGVTTFGKGSVQDVIDLPGGSGLHVTIAKWLTPNGNSIHDVGITPDVVVKMTQDDIDNSRDPQLDEALRLL